MPASIDARNVPLATVHSTPNPFPADYALPGIDVEEDTEPVMVDDGTKVKDLIFLGLISCGPEDSVETVARTMIGNDIHAVIVKQDDQAIGVVSQTDIVLARQGRNADDLRTMTAREIMNEGCLTCDQETALSDAVTTMTKLRIHRLVVTEKRDGLDVPVGIISLTDVVRKLVVDS